MTAVAHAPAVITHGDSGETVSVDLTLIDALSVGQSLRMLARHPKTPPGTREIYARVGQQMVSKAHLAMKQRGAGRGRR